MYPFRNDHVYVRNTWYVAALRGEVNRQPFERTICDEPIVFYRTEQGAPAALYGLCPHRYYPLARGRLVGDAIECGYHGFTFDCSGQCVKVPSLGQGLSFTQRSYPVVEHGPWVWIWPGDPALADVSKLPDLDVLGCRPSGEPLPGWRVHAEAIKPFAARTQLIIDNLLDLTHIAFLHGALIDCSHLVRAPLQIEPLQDAGLRIRRPVERGPWDGFCEAMFTGAHRFGHADYHSETHFFGPGLITTSGYEFTAVDGARDLPPGLGVIRFGHAITPQTKHSGFYFSATCLNFRTDDEAFIRQNAAYTSAVVDQDLEAVNIMEPRIDQAAHVQRELLARSDVAAVRVRTHLQELIDRENDPAPLRTVRGA